MSRVITRRFNPEEDSGAIFSSWPRSVYYGAIKDITISKKKWHAEYYQYVKKMLEEATITIACLETEASSILGFCVISGTTLEWIAIKSMYQKQGIGKLLLKGQKITDFNKDNLTTIGQTILNSHPNLFNKGEDHEKEERRDPDPGPRDH